MANFERKTFNASDINGGQKFNNGDGISAEAINAPIESALLMQELATTQPQYSENGGSPSVTIENGQFVFTNLKGEKGEQGIQGEKGDGAPSNMSQNANKTIIVDGSVVDGNWNATFIVRQGGKQRPICTQYTDHTGAKAEMVTTANSAKFKFVNGSTDPQAYMEIFENSINFSKPITVQGNPVGGGSSGSGKTFASIMSVSMYWDAVYGSHPVYLLPRGFNNYKITAPEYGTVSLSKEQLELGSGMYSFSNDSTIERLAVLGNSPYYDPANLANDYYAVGVWHSYMDGEYYNSIGTMLLVME